MTPPDSDAHEPNLPCPHGRASWHHCPHCLGLNAPIPASTTALAAEQAAIVVLSHDLVQRILAALEADAKVSGDPALIYLAAELRAHLPKEPK